MDFIPVTFLVWYSSNFTRSHSSPSCNINSIKSTGSFGSSMPFREEEPSVSPPATEESRTSFFKKRQFARPGSRQSNTQMTMLADETLPQRYNKGLLPPLVAISTASSQQGPSARRCHFEKRSHLYLLLRPKKAGTVSSLPGNGVHLRHWTRISKIFSKVSKLWLNFSGIG